MNVMTDFKIKIKKEDKDNFTEVIQNIVQLSNLVMQVENAQDSNLEIFKKTLEDLIPKLSKEIDDCGKDATDEIFLSGDAKMPDMLKKLDEIEGTLKHLENTANKYQSWQEVLQTNQSTFDNLSQLREDFNIRAAMWRSLKEWETLTSEWVKTQFG